jgi:L-lactate utilization protein LutB
MAIVVDSVDIRGLRKTHFEQLMDYLLDAEEQDTYYGNYDQYARRHNDLKEWIKHIIKMLNCEGVVVPKKEVPCEADGGQ